MHFWDNTIANNSRFSLKVTGDKNSTLDAANNYWGAGIVGPAIGATMDACGGQVVWTLPCVTFKPFLWSPSPDAPPVSAG